VKKGRRAAVLSGLGVMVAGPLVAPLIPPDQIPALSIGWLAVGALLAITLLRWLWRRLGLPAVLAAVAVSTGVGWVVGRDWDGPLGSRLPCRRDWGWLPSYFLRSSPTESVAFALGTTRIKLCYGAPRLRGRKVLGGPTAPFGHLWRTGANEPTTIRASGPISIAGIAVPDGKASIYTVPGPETWEIVVNRSTSQWGIESEYSPAIQAQEIGRAVVAADSRARPVETLTFVVEPGAGSDDALLVLTWGQALIRIPIAALSR
jgi:hypothetical protein